jgi:tRNA 2-selenouridine synthase
MGVIIVPADQAAPRLADYDTVIDVRSPSEFAEDHLPGAVNWPVLDDDQRRLVGTLYKQVSPLEARKVGAALVARNVAEHLERFGQAQPREWKPLVYCWRGGQRSGSLAWFLGQIGFRTAQLGGGYKAFRATVVRDLETLPLALDLRVVCGRTGSGKTRLLQALRDAGGQVLDLEDLAAHRGSVLGGLPDRPQPSQKRFDTLLWQALREVDPSRPLFVESESKKIGRLRVPETLIQRMRDHGRCLRIEMPDTARVQLLLEDYAFFTHDVEGFCRQLDALLELRGKETVGAWQAAARAGRFAEVFHDLMRNHYDPLYERSMDRNFRGMAAAQPVPLTDGGGHSLRAAAMALLADTPPA